MDEKGFTLGTANRAKVTACAGRQSPRITHDGTREPITVIEACRVKRVMLPPMVVFKGTAYYKGWYTEVTAEKHAYFAYSPKGLYLEYPGGSRARGVVEHLASWRFSLPTFYHNLNKQSFTIYTINYSATMPASIIQMGILGNWN